MSTTYKRSNASKTTTTEHNVSDENTVETKHHHGKHRKRQHFSVVQKIREWLLLRVKEGTPVVLAIQRFRNPFLDFYFKLASFCGDKLFYITLVPCFFWFGDQKLGRLFAILLTANVYLGNFIKETFMLPRPPSPPCWRSKKEHDSGLPSTHSMIAISMSTYLIGYYSQLGLLQVTTPIILFTIFWVASIVISRMYLGVHSPADVTAGLTLGALMSWSWLRYGNYVDEFLVKDPNAPVTLMLFMILSTTIHPRSIHSPAYSRSVAVAGIGIGIFLSSWIRHVTEGAFPEPLQETVTPMIKSLVDNLKDSSLWSYTTPYVWRIIVQFSIGFVTLNVAFFLFLNILFFFFDALFSIPFVTHLIESINNLVDGRVSVPPFDPVEVEPAAPPKESSRKKRNRKYNTSVDIKTWSRFFALIALSLLLVDTVPTLLVIVESHFVHLE